MPWYCVCEHLNMENGFHCEKCEMEKTEKVWPAWQRAFHNALSDHRKYEAKSKKSDWTKKRTYKKRLDPDWW